mmetsp:Transcript_93212/g.207346  ORF Transcript_93212/g.207346 Transcript_93212/m.207346 type:complete len:256 (+) Transcript_93212:1120-1887(+)
MKIVCHQIDHVKVLSHCRDVIRLLHSAFAHTYCNSQKERVARVVRMELFPQDLQHADVVHIVLRCRNEITIGILLEAVVSSNHGIFPVEVKAIEAPILAERDDVLGKLPGLCLGCSNRAEDLTCLSPLPEAIMAIAIVEVPSAHTDERLDRGVHLFHGDVRALVATITPRRAARPLATLPGWVIPIWLKAGVVTCCGAEALLRLGATGMICIGVVALEIVASSIREDRGETVHVVRAHAALNSHLEHILALVDKA